LVAVSRGNPFVLGQYLRWLADRGRLSGRARTDDWPADVAAVLVSRLSKLSPVATETLAHAAVYGFRFSEHLIAHALRRPLRDALDEALQAELIEEAEDHGAYLFVHDRVREHLLSTVDAAGLRATSLRLADALAADPDDEAELFALARFTALGGADPSRVYETSVRAGARALEAHANDTAYEVLSAAFAAAPALELAPARTIELRELLGTACTRTGRVAIALEHFAAALALSSDTRTVARLRVAAGYAQSTAGNMRLAWEEMQAALGALGASVPSGRWRARTTALFRRGLHVCHARTGIGFGVSHGEHRDRRETLAPIYAASRLMAYQTGDAALVLQLSSREVHNAFFLGASAHYAKALVCHAWALSMGGDRLARAVDRYVTAGQSMAQQLGEPETNAYCDLWAATAIGNAGDVSRERALYAASTAKIAKHCPAQELSSLVGLRISAPFFLGKTREVVAEISALQPLLVQTGAVQVQILAHCFSYSAHDLLGDSKRAAAARDEARRLAETMPNVRHVEVNLLGHEIATALEARDLGADTDARIDRFLTMRFEDYHRRYLYLLVGYVRLAQFRASTDRSREHAWGRLREAVRMAAARSLTAVHRCHSLALRAAVAGIARRSSQATTLLARAAAEAERADAPWGRWSVAMERVHLARATGNIAAEEAARQSADAIARAEGWTQRTGRFFD
jgi:hypothetical protein